MAFYYTVEDQSGFKFGAYRDLWSAVYAARDKAKEFHTLVDVMQRIGSAAMVVATADSLGSLFVKRS